MNNENTILQALPVSMVDRIEALKQQAAYVIECWQPCAGDQLLGVLIGSQKSVGTYGENLQILIQGIDGTIKATWITAWLKDNLQLQNAGIVDLIALTFLGKREVELGVNITPTH